MSRFFMEKHQMGWRDAYDRAPGGSARSVGDICNMYLYLKKQTEPVTSGMAAAALGITQRAAGVHIRCLVRTGVVERMAGLVFRVIPGAVYTPLSRANKLRIKDAA